MRGVSAAHEARLCAGLEQAERQELGRLLRKVAAEQGLLTGVHPGLAEPAKSGPAHPEPESEDGGARG